VTVQEALEKLRGAGFAEAGACRFTPQAIRPGFQKRRCLPEGIQTILVGVYPYYSGDRRERNLSLYAVVPDYHVTLAGMLERAAAELKALSPGHIFLPFADNSPICEVEAACRAGLGVRGRHNLLITPRFGSFVFIGELLTTLPFEDKERAGSGCDGCGLCAAACPTSALNGNGGFERGRCLSYLTQKKGGLSPEEESALKKASCVWGCDLCQLACPRNKGVEMASSCGQALWSLKRESLEGLSSEQFRKAYGGRAFAWRGKETLLRNLRLLYEK